MRTPPPLPPVAVGRFRILRPSSVNLSGDGTSVVATYPASGASHVSPTSHVEYRSAWARFRALADVDGVSLSRRVLVYVRSYGALGVDADGHPTLMPDEGVKMAEGVEWYRYYARLGAALIEAASYANGARANAPRDAIRVLREHVQAGYVGDAGRKPFLDLPVYDYLALAPRRSGLWGADAPPPGVSVERFRALQGEVAATVLNWWLIRGHVFPKVIFVPGGFESLVGGGLWGALGASVLEAVLTRPAKDRKCDVCGTRIDISKRARAPQAGRLVLCSGKAGDVCRREASRRRVARYRATRVAAPGVEV